MNCKNEVQNWTLVKDTMNALELQILHTFDEGYLILLRQHTLGYAKITSFKMITYLKDTYSEIANEDSIALKVQLNEQYHHLNNNIDC